MMSRTVFLGVVAALLSLVSPLGTSSARPEPFISPEQIDSYFENRSPQFVGTGLSFVLYGLAYNLDPRLIVAIAGAETTFATNLGCNTEFNAWSWFWAKEDADGVLCTNKTKYPTDEDERLCKCHNSHFSSFDAAIHTVTRGLRRKYLSDPENPQTSIGAIGKTYCDFAKDPEGCTNWIGGVTKVYKDPNLGGGGDPDNIGFRPARKLFDMESPVDDWLATGFWHIVQMPQNIHVIPEIFQPGSPSSLVTLAGDDEAGGFTYRQGALPPAYSKTRAWWYGEDSTGTFIGSDFSSIVQTPKNGGISVMPNSGELITPLINLGGFSRAYLAFQTWWEIESVDADAFDILSEAIKIEVSTGSSFQEVGVLNPLIDVDGPPDIPYVSGAYDFEPFTTTKPLAPYWKAAVVDLTPFLHAGKVIQIRFRFDTGDDLYNGFRGWLIDDIAVFGVP